MSPDAEEKRREKNEAVKREMERKSNDELLVYNPSDDDYQIRWAGLIHTVPSKSKDVGYGKGKLVVARYLATHYFKHKINELINYESDTVVARAKKKYKGGHWPEEELKVALKTNNPKLRAKYLKRLFKGIHRQFGLDETPDYTGGKRPDKRPIDDQILEELEASMPPALRLPQPEVVEAPPTKGEKGALVKQIT